MVIFNHTNERGFYRYAIDAPGTFSHTLATFFSTACKSGVPIFFMISGATLLAKNESIGKTYHRVIKIFVDLILFQLFYFWLDSYLAEGEFSLIQTLQTMISSNYWHLWYLYAYIAFIFTLPFLREMVEGLTIKSTKIMYVLAVIILSVLPAYSNLSTNVEGINGNLFPSWITTGSIFIYPVLGYVIAHKYDINRLTATKMIVLWIVNIASFALCEVTEYVWLMRNPNSYDETFVRINMIENSLVLFLTVKWICTKASTSSRFAAAYDRVGRWISEIGKCTFGIYLFHILFLWKIPILLNIWYKIEAISRSGVYVCCLLVFIISGVLTYLLRKIPGVRKLL